MNAPAIEVQGLTKDFGRHRVLHGLDFTVPTGGVFGVIGPNGAGKTTTMRALLDIIRPTAGRISVLGGNPSTAGPELRRRIGYLPGELVLEGRTTGRRLLEHFAAISGPVAAGAVDGLADRLDVDLDLQVRRLSKGNKQKLGIIQAFMHTPDLLVLDEPTSGLDPLMQQVFLDLVRHARANGQTVFLSSHVLSEIQQAADQVAILRDGRIATISTVEELRATAVRRLRVVVGGLGAPALRSLLESVPGIGTITCAPARDSGRPTHDGGSAPPAEAQATLDGEVAPLLRALARVDVRDLVLEEPDLEAAVLRIYGTDPAAADAAAAEINARTGGTP